MTADELLRSILDAWTIEGPSPDTHREAQRSLRWRWPTLANALDNAVKERT